jgi:hypothetical protein
MIPRRSMPVIHMGDLSKRHLSLVLRQIVQSAHTKAVAPVGPPNAFHVVQDPALFADSVRSSVDLLSQTAARITASLQQRKEQSVRDYVVMLRRHVPSLTAAACDAYVAAYEDATDPDADPITREEYGDFVTNLHDLFRQLEQYSADSTAIGNRTRRKPSNAAVVAPSSQTTPSNEKPKRRKGGKKDGVSNDVQLKELKK